ncbi:hypothetical protein V494_08330 [Pseudogymnoascus sp. VKM F-4513 (FW-928)]|nr:hypothetical protein V494_08330 [Pseudogymnoascus sp. VKM F-4513 (FW-928)]
MKRLPDPGAERGDVCSQFHSQAVPPIQSFLLEVIDLAIEAADDVLGGLDGGLAVSLALPSLDAVDLLLAAAQFGRDLVTDAAVLGAVLVAVHDELHAAGLTGAVLLGTVLAEGAPLVVAAAVKSLVEEAHFEMAELQLKQMSYPCSTRRGARLASDAAITSPEKTRSIPLRGLQREAQFHKLLIHQPIRMSACPPLEY